MMTEMLAISQPCASGLTTTMMKEMLVTSQPCVSGLTTTMKVMLVTSQPCALSLTITMKVMLVTSPPCASSLPRVRNLLRLLLCAPMLLPKPLPSNLHHRRKSHARALQQQCLHVGARRSTILLAETRRR